MHRPRLHRTAIHGPTQPAKLAAIQPAKLAAILFRADTKDFLQICQIQNCWHNINTILQGHQAMADKYSSIIRQLEVKVARQKAALESTEQHIEAIKALRAQDEDKENAAKTPKK